MLREAPMPVKPEYEIVRPPTDGELADIIDKMIERLETYGWTRHSFGNPEGATCAEGAFRYVRGTPETYSPAYNAARSALTVAMGVGSIPRWNDMPWRTKGQVIRKLRRTARRLRPYSTVVGTTTTSTTRRLSGSSVVRPEGAADVR